MGEGAPQVGAELWTAGKPLLGICVGYQMLFVIGSSRLLNAYPHLTIEGITEALQYAARFLKNESILIAEVAA